MSNIAVAVAHELGNHIDDLVDSGITELDMPDAGGEVVGHLMDTTVLAEGMADNVFIVVLADGRKVRVTCEEIA